MTSPSYPVERAEQNRFVLPLYKRGLFVFLVCCIQMIYVPTSSRMTGGIEPKLPIDVFPVWSVWVLPYVLCYFVWFAAGAWVLFKIEDRDFRAFIAGCTLSFTIGTMTFLFFPTYVRSMPMEGNDVFAFLLRILHENWGRYDAFPSSHVYISTLFTLFFCRWYPRQKFLWITILILICLSTLFTGQHYILDVLGGFLVGLAGYRFGLWWAGLYPAQKRSGKRPRKRIISSPLN